MVYGAVLGDTLGLATEYLSADEIEFYYSGGRLSHNTIVQDEHRSHFQRGKTTCVSDFMVCVLIIFYRDLFCSCQLLTFVPFIFFCVKLLIFDSILQWSGVLDELELAQRLIDYSVNGVKDLIHRKPFITSTIINRLLSQ